MVTSPVHAEDEPQRSTRVPSPAAPSCSSHPRTSSRSFLLSRHVIHALGVTSQLCHITVRDRKKSCYSVAFRHCSVPRSRSHRNYFEVQKRTQLSFPQIKLPRPLLRTRFGRTFSHALYQCLLISAVPVTSYNVHKKWILCLRC